MARLRGGAFLAPTLHEVLGASHFDRADRALVTDLGYGAARRMLQLDAVLAPLLKRPDRLPAGVSDALRLGAFEILYRGTPPYAAVDVWVRIVKREAPGLAGLVNAVLRRVRPLPDDAAPAVRASLPDWLFTSIAAAVGEHAQRACEAMLDPEPLWLTAFDGAAARAALESNGASVVEHGSSPPGGPTSLRVMAPVSVDRLAAFTSGLVQPQNPASLRVALLLNPSPGSRVLDLASGRGVKTAVLAALGADVCAVELDPRRSADAERNLRRLGLAARHVGADLTSPLDLPPAPYVLLDAPCSGTGTLRGHPEIKLRLAPTDVKAAAEKQALMLRTAAEVVEPGGLLQYAVCSLTPEEGPRVVERFLASGGGAVFAPESFDLGLPGCVAGPGQYVLPLGGLDGFYVARLRRLA